MWRFQERLVCLTAALAVLAASLGAVDRAIADEPLASESSAAQKSETRLLAASLDGRVMAFVEVSLAPGWKTYWRNPGDAGGLPPSFTWEGSANLRKAEPLFPAPTRFTDKAGDTVGYKTHVIFPVEIQREEAVRETRLALSVQYGICKDICVPVDAHLELSIPAANLPEANDELRAALAAVPRGPQALKPEDPAVVSAEAVLSGDKPHVTVVAKFPGGTDGADVFLDAGDGLFLPHPSLAQDLGGGTLRFEADLSADVDLAGLADKELVATLVGGGGASYATVTKK